MSSALITKSNNKRETAYDIINDTSVIDIFSKIGKVEIVGSLRLDLMFRNDIDILVISDDIKEQDANNVTKQLLDSNMFQTVAQANYNRYTEGELPKGIYWELIVIKNNEKWKFDIWYLKPEEEYARLVLSSVERFEKVLKTHPEKRETILKIKEEYFDGVKYRDNVKSIDIYNAVLVNGVSSVEEFNQSNRN